jgi:hypothetical protein
MLSAIVNAAKFAQIRPKLPKTAKICPKIISFRNFEMPPEIEILVFLKKKNSMCRGSTRLCVHLLDFQYNNFYMFLFLSKNGLCM